MGNNLWSKEEMLLALNLYLKIPFGNLRSSNSEVIKLARLIHRTPNSVALRLGNYAACDPQLKKRGIKGMDNGSKKCQEIWHEYFEDRERLAYESECILATYEGRNIEEKFKNSIKDMPSNIIGLSKESIIKSRINQNVFRKIILANYNNKCALTGIDIPDLLVASHIIPWSKCKKERLNPSNGICLSLLYDKAFDRGLISFDKNYRVIFSEKLLSRSDNNYYDEYFRSIYKRKLAAPMKYEINQEFLEWHRDMVFNK